MQESDISNELARQQMNSVSFVFLINWYHYLLEDTQNKKSPQAFKYILDAPISDLAIDESSRKLKMVQLQIENEILSMTYLNYLEEREFLVFNQQILFGDLLRSLNHQFDQNNILLLEMLKIFFPAGNEIPAVDKHSEF